MADLSKIKLNGTTYNFKDAEARDAIENLSFNDLNDIPTIPTDTNDLSNSAGFISTETDPTVPSWAKASSPPVASVNGTTGTVVVDKLKTTAINNNTEYNLLGTASTNGNTSAVTIYNQMPLSFAKTTDLSRLTIGSTSLPGVIRIYTSTNGASGYTDIKSNASGTTERTIALPDASGTMALTSDIPNVPSWAMASSKPTYTASEVGATTSQEVSDMIT